MFHLHDSIGRVLKKQIQDPVVIEVTRGWLADAKVNQGLIKMVWNPYLQYWHSHFWCVWVCVLGGGSVTCGSDLSWRSIFYACLSVSGLLALTPYWNPTPESSRSCWSSGWRQCPNCCGCHQNRPQGGAWTPRAQILFNENREWTVLNNDAIP